LGVQEKAIELAQRFQFSQYATHQVSVAGLLHDCAKPMPQSALLQYLVDHQVMLEEADRNAPQTLHALVGALKVQEVFNIQDHDILNAIRYHTTGRPGMTPVEKVVYIADKIEDRTRNPVYCQAIASHLPNGLDSAMLAILDNTLKQLEERKLHVHPASLQTRESLLQNHKENPA
jgi:predicted HD superfamily hydrolase involved in NAD metabolism